MTPDEAIALIRAQDDKEYSKSTREVQTPAQFPIVLDDSETWKSLSLNLKVVTWHQYSSVGNGNYNIDWVGCFKEIMTYNA